MLYVIYVICYMAFNRRLEIRFEPLDWHTCKESTGNSYDKSVEINNSLRWSINDSTAYSSCEVLIKN